MKIAQVVCVFPPYKSGLGNAALNLAVLSADSSNESVVFTPFYKNFSPDESSKENIKVEKLLPFLVWGNAAVLPQLLWKLRNFDIVCLHYPFFGSAEIVWLAKVVLRQKFKLLIYYHMDTETLPKAKKIFAWPSRIILPRLLAVSSAIVCASFDYLNTSRLNKYFQKYQEKFHEIPFGVDVKKFIPAFRTNYGDFTQLLFVGALDMAHNFKGLNLLLLAVSKIKICNFHLNIVGDGEAKDVYAKRASELGLDGKVTFCGSLTNEKLVEIYTQADILILPSINSHEAFGIVLLEAMASGLAVIASSLPGVRQVFTDKREGLLIEPGNEEDLRSKIEFLLNNKDVLTAMKLSARRLAETKYSNEIIDKKNKNLLISSFNV